MGIDNITSFKHVITYKKEYLNEITDTSAFEISTDVLEFMYLLSYNYSYNMDVWDRPWKYYTLNIYNHVKNTSVSPVYNKRLLMPIEDCEFHDFPVTDNIPIELGIKDYYKCIKHTNYSIYGSYGSNAMSYLELSFDKCT